MTDWQEVFDLIYDGLTDNGMSAKEAARKAEFIADVHFEKTGENNEQHRTQ